MSSWLCSTAIDLSGLLEPAPLSGRTSFQLFLRLILSMWLKNKANRPITVIYQPEKDKKTTHIFLFPHIKIHSGQRNFERYCNTAFLFTNPLGYEEEMIKLAKTIHQSLIIVVILCTYLVTQYKHQPPSRTGWRANIQICNLPFISKLKYIYIFFNHFIR